jgi:hypothetical protein
LPWKVLQDVFSFQVSPRATFSTPDLLLSPRTSCQRTAVRTVVLGRAVVSILKSAEIRTYVTEARIEGEI